MPKIAGATMIDNFKVSAQWSRRMNSLKLWLTLKIHGRRSYEDLIDRQLHLSRVFADWIRRSDQFELALDPQLTIVNFRLKDSSLSESELAAAHARLVEEITRDGQRWISGTVAAWPQRSSHDGHQLSHRRTSSACAGRRARRRIPKNSSA